MAKWIRSANVDDYDIFGAFTEFDSVYWSKSNYQIKKGDEVYLYVTAPYSKIMFRMLCIADDVSSNDKEWKKDHAYNKKQNIDDDLEKVVDCIHLKKIEECNDGRLSHNHLQDKKLIHDYKFQGAISNKPENRQLFEYIESIFREYNENIQQIDVETNDLKGIEKHAYIKVRVNQTTFRNQLLEKYQKCCLCGIDEPKLLIASHIKPWANSQDVEKLDFFNGLLFCPHHDKLFDLGLIGFDEQGRILISPKLKPHNQILLNLHNEMKIHVDEKHQHYLDFHRQNIFQAA